MTPPGYDTYAAAAQAFADLVERIPSDSWAQPGLGQWDLRDLVGHTSRSLVTVADYLPQSADHEDIDSAADYYARLKAAGAFVSSGVTERGRDAGRVLGDDPAASVARLLADVLPLLAAAEDGPIAVIGGLGIRLSEYLKTRVFELAVHCGDIAAAADIPLDLPQEVAEEALVLAARIALLLGDGSLMLSAMTGRSRLPDGFTVV